MDLCLQATSNYLSQCWPTTMSPNGVIRTQCVKTCGLFHTLYDISRWAYLTSHWRNWTAYHQNDTIRMMLVTNKMYLRSKTKLKIVGRYIKRSRNSSSNTAIYNTSNNTMLPKKTLGRSYWWLVCRCISNTCEGGVYSMGTCIIFQLKFNTMKHMFDVYFIF